MKKLSFLTIFSAIFAISISAQNAELNIIPQPKSATRRKGEFKLNDKTKIVAADEPGRRSAGIFNDLLMKNYGLKLETTGKPQKKNFISRRGVKGQPLRGVSANEIFRVK
jgi:hypothetical protein